MNESLLKIFNNFLEQAVPAESTHWQAVPLDDRNPMYEQENIFFDINIENPILDLNPDTEWCEVHFKERVSGKPFNPGDSYKQWPYYYKDINNDELFRQGGKFSHTYMERFWPKYAGAGIKTIPNMGIRYEYGDLQDVINLLKSQPGTRQAFLSIWHPEDQSNSGVRVPCTIGYWFKKKGNPLNVTYLIRSCDIVRHFRNDIYLTWLLLCHVAEELNLEPGTISMWIGSLHCFKSDFYYIKNKILK